MAMLVHRETEVRVALAAHAIIGRSSACTVRVEEPRASAEHARLSYRSGVWTVRDLGSRNGTFVNGDRLPRGTGRPLAAGDEIVFGGPGATWLFADDSPPVAFARRLADGAILPAAAGLLALPSAEEPTVSLVEAEDGKWTVESDGTARLAADGEVLSIGGHAFMLHLPTPLPATVQEDERSPAFDDFELGLRVSSDEETVEVSLRGPDGLRVLSPRAHHYTLLTLARIRLRAREQAELGEPQRGWVASEDLCRMLGIDEIKLNVEIYRIRREMAALGLVNAAQLIERRRGSRQLRLGTEHVSIRTFSRDAAS
jgi:hypothetical protein